MFVEGVAIAKSKPDWEKIKIGITPLVVTLESSIKDRSLISK